MIEETKKRLQNIKAIEPYVNAMRTSSLGLWKTALNRINAIQSFRSEISKIEGILPEGKPSKKQNMEDEITHPQTYVVIGSQKGLVSNFNRNLIPLLEQMSRSDANAVFKILTNRPNAFQSFREKSEGKSEIHPFVYDLHYQRAVELFQELGLEPISTQSLYYIYNRYDRGQGYTPTVHSAASIFTSDGEIVGSSDDWPPYLMDSSPDDITAFLKDLLKKAAFHFILATSIASENRFRNRILEEAKNNTERLIEELSIELATARKKEITKEIQELAVAAGLIE